MRLIRAPGKRLAAAVIFGLCGAAGTGLFTPTANAAGLTCGTIGNYFEGVGTAAQASIFGARATIETVTPPLCSAGTSPSESTVWAMVAAHRVGAPHDDAHRMYAQAGYVNSGPFSGDPIGLTKFAQFTKACSPGCKAGELPFISWYSNGAPSGSLTYVAKYQNGDGLIHMYANGVDVLQTTYATTGVWESAWNAYWSAETFHIQTDIVGRSSNKASLWNMQTYSSSGSAVFPASIPIRYDYVPNYRFNFTSPATGGTGIDLWTS